MEGGMSQDLQEIAEGASISEWPLKNRIIASVVLAIVAVLSAFLLSGIFSSPDAYSKTIESLDSKKATVLALTAASTGASAALSAIPDDTCTPLAERLADLSGDFLVILTAIYLEKYLLTTFGFATFAILIPASCILTIGALLIRRRPGLRRPLARLAEKLALLGVALVLTVPVSVLVSDKIEATYEDSISNTIQAAQITAEAAEDTSEEAKRDEATNILEFFQQRVEDLANAAGSAAGALGDALEWVQNMIGNFIEAVAVMIVISCIIPILVLVFFLWIVKLILGVNVEVPMGMLRPGAVSRMVRRG
ncbi:MAG: hypothetical protein IJI68_06625 [Eggerthellaceae bacterium]|nr:hypothetical protein [Eggerthellaceae bacterium]